MMYLSLLTDSYRIFYEEKWRTNMTYSDDKIEDTCTPNTPNPKHTQNFKSTFLKNTILI